MIPIYIAAPLSGATPDEQVSCVVRACKLGRFALDRGLVDGGARRGYRLTPEGRRGAMWAR